MERIAEQSREGTGRMLDDDHWVIEESCKVQRWKIVMWCRLSICPQMFRFGNISSHAFYGREICQILYSLQLHAATENGSKFSEGF